MADLSPAEKISDYSASHILRHEAGPVVRDLPNLTLHSFIITISQWITLIRFHTSESVSIHGLHQSDHRDTFLKAMPGNSGRQQAVPRALIVNTDAVA